MNVLTLQGKYNKAHVFTQHIEQTAISQVINMLNEKITENTNVAIMPDVHAGKGSTIGTTIKLPENRNDWKICPNITGVDISCAIRAIRIKDTNIDFKKLDKVIKELVPSGNNIHEKPLKEAYDYAFNSKSLTFALSQEQKDKVLRSLGTLGGGNHYIGATRS